MKMTEQDKGRFFRDIQVALANQKIDVSEEAIRIFFEDGDVVMEDHYTLPMSYQVAKNHPYFSQIAEAQETTFDFPGIIFSFTNETYCVDCGSDEMAEETGAWSWILNMLGTPDNIDDSLRNKGYILVWMWCQILSKENKSIKEAMNFIYQHDLLNEVFPATTFRRHYGDFFIYEGYEKFNWTKGLIENYLPEIQKIDMSLKLEKDLSNTKTTTTRGKI